MNKLIRRDSKEVGKTLCTGCSACSQVCPNHCIEMEPDQEGFLYPVLRSSNCIDCGLCEKACFVLHPKQSIKPLKILAAINSNSADRLKSSSGGIFPLLAKKTIENGGIVFGVRFDKDWNVVMSYTDNIDDVVFFQGSKYVQAKIGDMFMKVRSFLKEGKLVLFSGTGCQIAGLNNFLGRSFDNLLTVEVLCHGVPSPLLWKKYINDVPGSIQSVSFREKTDSWKRFHFSITSRCGHTLKNVSVPFYENYYMRVFLENLSLRPSCYSCFAKNGSSGSDIIIGDYWTIDQVEPEMFDDKGTSVVLLNTTKAINYFPFGSVKQKETTLDKELSYNGGFRTVVAMPSKRKQFYKRMNSDKPIVEVLDGILRPTIFERFLRKCASINAFIKR